MHPYEARQLLKDKGYFCRSCATLKPHWADATQMHCKTTARIVIEPDTDVCSEHQSGDRICTFWKLTGQTPPV